MERHHAFQGRVAEVASGLRQVVDELRISVGELPDRAEAKRFKQGRPISIADLLRQMVRELERLGGWRLVVPAAE